MLPTDADRDCPTCGVGMPMIKGLPVAGVFVVGVSVVALATFDHAPVPMGLTAATR